jgi:hypothetical protein
MVFSDMDEGSSWYFQTWMRGHHGHGHDRMVVGFTPLNL